MNRFKSFIQPFLLAVTGVFLFLYYLNWLSMAPAATIVIGSLAIAVAGYYVFYAVAELFFAKLLKGKAGIVLHEATILAFPSLMAALFLTVLIVSGSATAIGGWFVNVLGISVSLGFIVLHLLLCIRPLLPLRKIVLAAGGAFGLILLLNVLFELDGDARALGNIDLVQTIIFVAFGGYLFSELSPLATAEPEKPAEEEPEEEKPTEEEPSVSVENPSPEEETKTSTGELEPPSEEESPVKKD